MPRRAAQHAAPSAAEKAMAQLIVGLLLAITTPFLLPTGLVAIWVGVSLARHGHRAHAAIVLVVAVGVLAAVIAGIAG
jgi:sulfite exporter TauE/SafE